MAMERLRPVGVFDSGMGGISVLAQLMRQMPGESFVYYGDQAHVPYGSRSVEEIRSLVEGAVARLLTHDIKALAVACNTATSAAIETLRATYDFPIIGVEPAVKPAVLVQRPGDVLVMATPRTLSGDKYQEMIARYQDVKRIVAMPCPGLVELIETRMPYEPIARYMDEHLPVKPETIGVVVLGCTHYVLIQDLLRRYFGGDIPLMDGGEGAARQLRRKLMQIGQLAPDDHKPEITLMTSGSGEHLRFMRQFLTEMQQFLQNQPFPS